MGESNSRTRSRQSAVTAANNDVTADGTSSGTRRPSTLRKPRTGPSKLRVTARSQSNVFAMFSQAEIQELKEEKEKKKKRVKKEKTTEDKPEKSAAAEENGETSPPPREEPKRAQRGTSNVFALFNQAQIQEFKEAFTMMDQDRDGIINEGDLAAIFQQTGRDADPKMLREMITESPTDLNFTHFLTLFGEKMAGRDPPPETLEAMVNEAPGPLNFTMFLSLFGDKLKGTDPEHTLRDAFKLFDEDQKNYLDEEYVKDLLMNVGDQFDKSEIKQVWKEAPLEGGKLDYQKFVTIIKRGKDDE